MLATCDELQVPKLCRLLTCPTCLRPLITICGDVLSFPSALSGRLLIVTASSTIKIIFDFPIAFALGLGSVVSKIRKWTSQSSIRCILIDQAAGIT